MADAATPPTISGNIPKSEVGVQFTFTPTITSSGSYTVAVADGTLPKGLVLNQSTGVISGTPTTQGDYSFTLSVTDANGTSSQPFTGTVYPALTIGGTPPKGKTGIAYSFTPVVSGGSGNYTFTSTGDAGGLTVSKTDGTISGTPPTSGNYAFTITVNDGLASTNLTANIEIDENIIVTFTNAPQSGYTGQVYNWTPTFKNQKDGSTLTVVVLKGTLPDGLTLDAHTGIISGTPTTIETSSFELNVSDGTTASSQDFTVKIFQSLKLTGTPSVGKVGTAYSFVPTASGGDSTQYAYSLVTGPGSDVFPMTVDPKTGEVKGTAVVGGKYPITIALTDGTATVQTIYTLDIRALLKITGIPNVAIVGTPFKFTPTVVGGTGNYTFSTTLVIPSPLTFDNKTGTIKGFPNTTDPVSGNITVDDGDTQQSLKVTLTFEDRHAFSTTFRLEHYSGYGGTGAPNYSRAKATDASETYNLGYVAFDTTVPKNTAGWGFGTLWSSFKGNDGAALTTNDFWSCHEIYLGNVNTSTEVALSQYAPLVFHGNAEQSFIFLRADPTKANSYRVLLSNSLSETVNFIDTGIRVTTVNAIISLYFNVVGGGTSNGSITLYQMNTPRSQWLTLGTWTGDLTNFKDFSAVSHHLGSPNNLNTVYYSFVTNYDLHYAYLRYTVATGEGTETGWTGDTSTFATYPVSYNLTGGLYATQAGQTVTLAFGSDIAPVIGVEPKTVILSGAFVTDSSATTAPVKGVVKGTDGTIVEVGPAQTPDDQGEAFTWVMSKNPLTGALWTAADAAALEYGYRRVTPPLAPLTLTGTPTKSYVSAAYSYVFIAGGGDSTQYKFSADTLPAGLTINGATGEVSGKPTATGTVNSVITLSDGQSTTTLKATFATNPQIALTGTSPVSGYIGKDVDWTPTIGNVAAGQTAVVTVSAGGLPPGLSLNKDSGEITGKPTTSGNYDFVLSVTDTITANTLQMTITVADSVSLTGAAPSAGYVGTAFEWKPTISNAYPGGTVKVTNTPALPEGLTLNSSTGEITGTPTTVTAPTDITFTTTDGNTATSRVISFSVLNAISMSGTPPVGYVSKTYSWVPTFTNQNLSGTLAVTLANNTTLPTGLTLNGDTGAISGMSTATGSTTFTLSASDGTSTGTSDFTIEIDDSISLTYGVLINGTVGTAISAITPTVQHQKAGTTLTFEANDSTAPIPAGLSINSTTGVISGTPTVAKSAAFTVTVSDGNTSAATRVYYNIGDVTFGATTAPSGKVGTAYTFDPKIVNHGTATMTVAATHLPDGLSINSSTGVVSGTPTKVVTETDVTIVATTESNYTNYYTIEIDSSFQLTAANLVQSTDDSSKGTLTLHGELNSTATATNIFTAKNTTTAVNSLTRTLVSGDVNGTTFADNGSYTLNTKTAGTTTFVMGYTDTATNSTYQVTWVINISGVTYTDGPLDDGVIGAPYSYDPGIKATGSTISSITASGLPTGLSINGTTGVISGTVGNDVTADNYDITFTVVDQYGTTTWDETLTIDPKS